MSATAVSAVAPTNKARGDGSETIGRSHHSCMPPSTRMVGEDDHHDEDDFDFAEQVEQSGVPGEAMRQPFELVKVWISAAAKTRAAKVWPASPAIGRFMVVVTPRGGPTRA